MTTTKKELFVIQAAAKFRVPESIVRLVVNEWETVRKSRDDGPTEAKHIGGGWYRLPDGRKVRGKDAAREALTNG